MSCSRKRVFREVILDSIASQVSIIIPCFNEQNHIANCLDSILAGDYPSEKLEILVVDGGSNDKTRDIIQDYCSKGNVVKLVDNPFRLKPHGLNIGIKAAKGDIIIRMDAHALYDRNYVSKSVKYLFEWNADNVGGVRKTLPSGDSLIAKSIAESISNRFSAGNAIYRVGADEFKWVDTVFGGCYRREIFEKIGLFNEALVRGQDREFNYRLQNSGGKILFAPDIVCYYFARGSLKSFLPWIFSAGMTPFFVSRLIGTKIYSVRNLIPLTFFLSLIVLPPLSLLNPIFFLLLAVEAVAYIACAIGYSIPIVKKEKDFRFFLTMPLIFFLTHSVYGAGAFIGLFKSSKNPGEWTKV